MPRILFVDDEPGMLVLFERLLRQAGYDVFLADGGAAAIQVLEETTPDLLVLDLAMPEVRGVDVLRYVRERPYLDAMRVMIFTARSMDPEVEALGIDGWVSKPILPFDFLDAVQHLI